MDLLKRELERKKKSVQRAKSSSGGRRYIRASELRKQEEDEEEENAGTADNYLKRKYSSKTDSDNDTNEGDVSYQKNAKKSRDYRSSQEDDKRKNNGEADSTHSSKASNKIQNYSQQDNTEGEISVAFNLSPEEVAQRLRALGYPVKLFGESARDLLKRLRDALDEQKNVQAGLSEMEEYRLGRSHRIRNPFLVKDQRENEEEANLEAAQSTGAAAKVKKEDADIEKDAEDYDLTKETDCHKRIYKYFKGLIKQWENDLNQRPDSIKMSVLGRNELKTMKQCKDYIRPMFKLCKNRRLDESILVKLDRIVSFCLEEEFVKAHGKPLKRNRRLCLGSVLRSGPPLRS